MSAQLACKPYEIMVNCVHGEQAPLTERQQQMNTNSNNTTEVRFYKIRAGVYATGRKPEVGVFYIVRDLQFNFWKVAHYVVNQSDDCLDLRYIEGAFHTLIDAKRYVRSLVSTNQEGGK